MITCSQAVKQLWEYLDGAVGDTERTAMDEHLSVCKRCCGEMEFADELRGFLASHADEEVPEDVKKRINGFLEALEQ